MRSATWNMQGSSHSTENKWNAGIGPLLGLAGVVCLQECGGVPASARLEEEDIAGVPGLELYAWGTERNARWILYYPADPNGNRCNLAVVTRDEPTDFAFVVPAADPVWRPAIGARVGGTWWFSLHAISGGGPDARGLLRGIDGLVDGWFAAGDFNREPDTLEDDDWTVLPPNGPTYPSKDPISKYDYAATSGADAGEGEVQSLLMSDHLAVVFDQAEAEQR